ncbi:MAG: hypothetical protein LV481_01035 [Methylacidiphilales bacterium]|nr:hypothetical protein [Candidatus Methylacidiphilales bacterium]
MFEFLRKRESDSDQKKSAPQKQTSTQPNPQAEAAWLAALKDRIAERKQNDPLIGPKIGAKEISGRLMNGLKSEKGVHLESYLTVLGALAGFSCQMSVRVQAGTGPIAWAVAHGKDGKDYYLGDALNKPLAEDNHSIWSLTAGAVQSLGDLPPDVGEIFKHVAATIGSAEFGIPRIPAKYRPGDLPINYLKVIWPKIFPVVRVICEEPTEWPILFGIAIQQAITMGKDVIEPVSAAKIVMECAIPMSKVDLPEFY